MQEIAGRIGSQHSSGWKGPGEGCKSFLQHKAVSFWSGLGCLGFYKSNLRTSEDGDSTTSLGYLQQCWAVFMGKKKKNLLIAILNLSCSTLILLCLTFPLYATQLIQTQLSYYLLPVIVFSFMHPEIGFEWTESMISQSLSEVFVPHMNLLTIFAGVFSSCWAHLPGHHAFPEITGWPFEGPTQVYSAP